MAREAFSYRRDPSVPPFPDEHPILVFDGKCVLCSGFARFILRHDRQRRFRLLAAQTPLGTALYQHFDLAPVDYETNILIENGRPWLKSEGSIRVFERLGFPWSLVAILRLLPLPVRDRLYEIVARNRLRWFGARETCYLPEASETDRFLTHTGQ
jgi:predicted DCC family thiol-disulfide oxidoreductase YuxK